MEAGKVANAKVSGCECKHLGNEKLSWSASVTVVPALFAYFSAVRVESFY